MFPRSFSCLGKCSIYSTPKKLTQNTRYIYGIFTYTFWFLSNGKAASILSQGHPHFSCDFTVTVNVHQYTIHGSWILWALEGSIISYHSHIISADPSPFSRGRRKEWRRRRVGLLVVALRFLSTCWGLILLLYGFQTCHFATLRGRVFCWVCVRI